MGEGLALVGWRLCVFIDFMLRLGIAFDIGPGGGCLAQSGRGDRGSACGSFVQVDSAQWVGRVELLLLGSVPGLDGTGSLGSLGRSLAEVHLSLLGWGDRIRLVFFRNESCSFPVLLEEISHVLEVIGLDSIEILSL